MEDDRQYTKNPKTNEWEYLTPKEWNKIRHGFLKDANVSDWVLAILDGPRWAVRYAFGLSFTQNPGTIFWLTNKYEKWPTKLNTATLLYNWAEQIRSVYDLDSMMPILETAYHIQKKMVANLQDQVIISTKLQEKKEQLEENLRRYRRRQKKKRDG